jgi:hypothetical protein
MLAPGIDIARKTLMFAAKCNRDATTKSSKATANMGMVDFKIKFPSSGLKLAESCCSNFETATKLSTVAMLTALERMRKMQAFLEEVDDLELSVVVATSESDEQTTPLSHVEVATLGPLSCDDSGIIDDSEQEPCFDLSPIKWHEGEQSPDASIDSLNRSLPSSNSFTSCKRRTVGKRTAKAIAKEFKAMESNSKRKVKARQLKKSKPMPETSFELPPLHSLKRRSKPQPPVALATEDGLSSLQSKHKQQMDNVRSVIQDVEQELLPTMVQPKLVRVAKQAAVDEHALRRQFPQQALLYDRYVEGRCATTLQLP